MIFSITVGFIVASMLALIAFLQTRSRWWIGPSAALALFIVCIALLFFVHIPATDNSEARVLLISGAIGLCALLVLFGAIIAFVLRRKLSSGRIAAWTFGCSFVT